MFSRKRRLGTAWWLASLIVLGAASLLTFIAQQSENGVNVTVIRHDVAMREEPMLAGEAGARARAGEVGRVREANTTWRYVLLCGGRAGWVESEALRSLAKDDGREVARAEARIAGESPVP